MSAKKSLLLLTGALLFFCLNTRADVPNGGFETWVPDTDGILYPEGWQTTNNTTDTSVRQYTPAHQGNFSMMVRSFDAGVILLGGVASLDFPYTMRPVTFSACLKSSLVAGDTAYIYFTLWKGDSVIASPTACTFKIDSSINSWTCTDFPITYRSSLTPDSANILIMSGLAGKTHVGNYLIVDELSLGFGTGFKESNSSSVSIGQNFPNPASSSTSFPLKLGKGSEVTLCLYNILGKELKRTEYGFLGPGEHDLKFFVDDLPNGIYQVQLKYDGNYLPVKKFLKLN